MFKVEPSLLSIASPFQGILLDAYGVFWGGNKMGLLPHSKEVMETLVAHGKKVGILSNSSQVALREKEKLLQHGLKEGTHYHFLLTSGEICRLHFSSSSLPFPTPKKSYYLFCKSHPKYSSPHTLFEASPFKEALHPNDADFIYISIPHIEGIDQTDPHLFEGAVEKLKTTDLPMVCANPDRFAHEGDPVRAVVRQGSIAELYEKMGGTVFYIGKPHPEVFNVALSQFNLPPEQILMVGDTPETDIRGANRMKMSSALTLKTGLASDRIQKKGLTSFIETLPLTDRPTFYIDAL